VPQRDVWTREAALYVPVLKRLLAPHASASPRVRATHAISRHFYVTFSASTFFFFFFLSTFFSSKSLWSNQWGQNKRARERTQGGA